MIVTATIISGDYDLLLVTITFPSGSADGDEMCASVTVNSDNLVEFKENFTVNLALVTSDASLSLGSNTSTITLIDSDGNAIVVLFFPGNVMTFILAAATFEIPTTALVAESDLALTLCATMTTTPPRSSIANEVVLSLFTIDGTGETSIPLSQRSSKNGGHVLQQLLEMGTLACSLCL